MLRLLLLTLLLCSLSAVVTAQTNTATVTGADKLVVRRGPGKQFPPFASLTDGSKVEVEQIEGEWARIITGNGQRGYVHSNFLAVSGDAPQAAPNAAAPAEAAPAPATGAAPEPTPARAASDRGRTLEADLKSAAERKKVLEAEVRTASERTKALEAELKTATERSKTFEADTAGLTERNKALETELQSTRQALSDLKNRPSGGAAAHESPGAPKARIDDLQAELIRLTAAVESLQTRLSSAPASNAVASGGAVAPSDSRNDDVLVSTTAILLGLVGIVVGWGLSGAFGRKQERGKRARIRF